MPLNLLCWEGYDADLITRRFQRDHGLELNAQTLLSDALIADQLLHGEYPDCDLLNINNPWVRDCLEPAGEVLALNAGLRDTYLESIHDVYRPFLSWSGYSSSNSILR